MERRDFLKLASLAGLAVASGGAITQANAFDPKSKTLWLMIDAGGGWDPTSFVDPKGSGNGLNKYPESAIKQRGNIRWAPMDASPDVQGTDVSAIDSFFEDHYQDLLVFNGVDTATNSHDVGSRNVWSGGLMEGRATLGAMIAAAQAKESPMAFITNGGYDFTGGIVGATRTGNIDAIIDIAYPNRVGFDEVDGVEVERTFHHARTAAAIQQTRQARYEALTASQRLPRVKAAMNRLYTARLGQNELAQLTAFLPQDIEDGLAGQAQLAIAAYRAGLCVAANLRAPGGYDTHGNNDVDQTNNYVEYMTQLRRVLQLAEDAKVRENVAIVMGSDFGRTPGYNEGNGKDHWSVTSMVMMGYVNGKKIRGDRVVGLSDEGHNPVLIDPNSFAASGGGERITPGVLHREIRKLAGVDQVPELEQAFPITDKAVMPGLIELEG